MTPDNYDTHFQTSIQTTRDSVNKALEAARPTLDPREVGRVTTVGRGVAMVTGLSGVRSEELLVFPGDLYGMALNVDKDGAGVVLLGDYGHLGAGQEVRRTRRVVDVPVGNELLGRVIAPTGFPLDDLGPVVTTDRLPIEREAPPIMHRDPVTTPLETGIKSVDALIPIGRGQRELILGDRQTGKTSIAVDTIINQKDKDVLCVYCAIGQRAAGTATVIHDLREHGAMEYTTVVVVDGDDPPGLQFIAPYAATSIAEHFMEQGHDVLIVYDDLTRHAQAYRELSLLLERPPGREAFPGDIFYVHSRLLERSTHLRKEYGGGSLTGLPIIETEAQNISAYIPTNLISITDGQIYLSPDLFQKGVLPAVDVGKSVSRVGGKTQYPAFRSVAGQLRLSYSQFEELEAFSRFGTRLDDATMATIEHGRRVREVLKQKPFSPLSSAEQIAVLLAVSGNLLDTVPLEDIPAMETRIREFMPQLPEISAAIQDNTPLSSDQQGTLLARMAEHLGIQPPDLPTT
ncbi:alternate F1F0 ATPase, F1 subunit alpha [Desulfoplanes formicivorans]|uniref:ATP synthase subunit alpha n=1 Tax=Desulfoplanes formicivorans TaxID=1592317 RepID=A0A194AHA2_9BACT|nr:alternate F1F0 ATPase, F1 subunit alpha [Desulfoplanes formicivorans]GAU09462.1 F0F1 ATP synthase subunit alpha [Desulfoplanes formicivorans]